jgi:hypothetical protein
MSTWNWRTLRAPAKPLALGAVAMLLALAPASAAPAGVQSLNVAPANAVQSVQHWRRGGWGWGAAPWIGLGAGIVVGSIIADRAYRPRPGYYYDDYAYEGPYYYPSGYDGDPRAICAQSFRSFEWNTGLYTTYSGEKRLCPYLR